MPDTPFTISVPVPYHFPLLSAAPFSHKNDTILFLFQDNHFPPKAHPSATSNIIMMRNPAITPAVPRLECSP